MSQRNARQAVVLAGGRGTRLGSLTLDRPKPMIAFGGRPFLEYLVAQLAEQGIEEIVMLLGYRADAITAHFGDGTAWGVRVRYSISATETPTAARVLRARHLLADRFLLLYCDNYWPISLDVHLAFHEALHLPVMVTVYSNDDRYSRDNVRVEGGRVTAFDRTRSQAGLSGVEIGYAVMERSVLDLLDASGDEQIEHALYPRLVAEGRLGAMVTRHRYYSVGSTERLGETDRFLARRPAVVLDRDGVLNVRPPRAQYVRTPAEFQWIPGSLEALRSLREAGFTVIVVSNQAGIARGQLSVEDLARVHEAMRAEATRAGGSIDAIYHCPHGWDDGCDCRKPSPGMLFQAQREWALDLTRTPFIGDDERDEAAAQAAGMPFLAVDDQFDLLDRVRGLIGRSAAGIAS